MPQEAARDDADAESRADARIVWAELLRRTFAIDVLRCARCGGQRSIVGIVRNATAARTIRDHQASPPESPKPHARPALAGWLGGTPACSGYALRDGDGE